MNSVDGHVTIGRRGQVHYTLTGATPPTRQPPLVFLHEGLGSVALWRSFPDDVCAAMKQRTTFVYSRHGYGRSSIVSEPRMPTYMHDEALDVLPQILRHFGLERPILIGHSDGASIALLHAGSGHDVAGLVLLAPHVFVEDCSIAAIEKVRESFATTDLSAKMARHHDDPSATFRGWNDVWLSPEFRDWNITSVAESITAPTLLIQGERDRFGTGAQLEAIARSVQGRCETVLLPGVGHSPHLEAPDETLAAVVRFLDSLDTKPGRVD